jgi:hypothetical protein
MRFEEQIVIRAVYVLAGPSPLNTVVDKAELFKAVNLGPDQWGDVLASLADAGLVNVTLGGVALTLDGVVAAESLG